MREGRGNANKAEDSSRVLHDGNGIDKTECLKLGRAMRTKDLEEFVSESLAEEQEGTLNVASSVDFIFMALYNDSSLFHT